MWGFRAFVTTFLLCGQLLLTGCATFLNDDHQMVAFSSEPDGATVKVDGVAMGKTPSAIPVPRKGGDKVVSFELDGYKTLMLELDNNIHAAGFGNLLLGGIIGIGVDAISGRAGSYQNTVHVMLERGSGTVSIDSDSLQEAQEKAKEQFEDGSAQAPANENSGEKRSKSWITDRSD